MTRTLWKTRRAFGALLIASGAQVPCWCATNNTSELRGTARQSCNSSAPSYPQGVFSEYAQDLQEFPV